MPASLRKSEMLVNSSVNELKPAVGIILISPHHKAMKSLVSYPIPVHL